jgi:hypothetical protein
MNEATNCCLLLSAKGFLCRYFKSLEEVLPWVSLQKKKKKKKKKKKMKKKMKKDIFPFALGHLLSIEEKLVFNFLCAMLTLSHNLYEKEADDREEL